jgi:hypothetical protein
MFRKALYSTSVRGPSDIWFWIYLLYLTPIFTLVSLEKPLYLYGYTVPVTLRPVIMYTSAKASFHSWGFDSDVLKGILWDSAAMNSEGSEIPMGPRK